ncbi:MAG: ribosome assembly factor SBDS [Candidatus Hodarchaeales archaeon]|jgi:ribosome maturation protein SDO1
MYSGGAQRERRVDLSNKALARLKYRGKISFEIIVDPKLAFKLRMKEINEDDVPILEIIEIDAVFLDASKGLRASSEELLEAFETDDELEVAKIILKKGELQLTQAQRDELAEKKKRQIITFISKNAINPQNNLPHPPTRIEAALQQGKIKIDPFDNVDTQIRRIIKELQPIIPLRLEQVKLAVKMPAEYSGKSYGVIKRYGEIFKEQWTDDGSWIVALQLPAGRQAEFMEKVEGITKGRSEMKVIERTRLD